MSEKLKILVVDDEISIQGILTEVLEEDGYEVDAAGSGEEALEIFEKDKYSLVITDIRMPGMTGIQLLQEIKKISPETQVIIITSHASMETAVKALRYGAYDYFIKPFEDLALISAMTSRVVERLRLIEENKRLLQELKQKNEQLEATNEILKNLAIRDGLTGLFNHRYFQESLNSEITRAKRHGHVFSLIMMDVDHFKQYNDTNGHPGGDKVLRTMGELLQKCTRTPDVVARYGGEEFVAILPETDIEGARCVAEKIRHTVENYQFEGAKTQPSGKVTVSIGVSSYAEGGSRALTVIDKADKALYLAKAEGRNRVVLSS